MFKRKKKNGCLTFFLFVIGFLFLVAIFGSSPEENNETSNTETNTESETEKNTEPINNTSEPSKSEETTEKKKDEKEEFISSIGEFVSEKDAKKTYNVYKKKLGFSNIEFDKRLDETYNFSISVDGYLTVATVMDGYIRIFMPNTEYVFYEDGEVLLTCSEFMDGIIDDLDMSYYYTIAKLIVEECLKSPKSAKYPSSDEISYQKKDNLVAIKGYVDALNSFGVETRSDYTVQFYVDDLHELSYRVTYAKIEDYESGEFIEIK